MVSGDANSNDPNSTAPKVTPASAWALRDLSLYVSAFYWQVVRVDPECAHFRMQRVRIRAAAYFGLQCNGNNVEQAVLAEHGVRPHMCASRDRYANCKCSRFLSVFWGRLHRSGCTVTIGQSNVLVELGGQNFEITDCDLLGTATIFHTGGGHTGGGKSCSSCAHTSTERYGVIARNLICKLTMLSRFGHLYTIIFKKASPLQGTPTLLTGLITHTRSSSSTTLSDRRAPPLPGATISTT